MRAPAQRTVDPYLSELIEEGRRRRISVYVESRAQLAGRPAVHLTVYDGSLQLGLGTFNDCRAALAWLLAGVRK